jgi:hypothetical protein
MTSATRFAMFGKLEKFFLIAPEVHQRVIAGIPHDEVRAWVGFRYLMDGENHRYFKHPVPICIY